MPSLTSGYRDGTSDKAKRHARMRAVLIAEMQERKADDIWTLDLDDGPIPLYPPERSAVDAEIDPLEERCETCSLPHPTCGLDFSGLPVGGMP